MDIEKFTDRAKGFLQAAQTIAIREFHQQLTPEHLLKALLDDDEGAAAGLIRAAGGDDKAVRTAVALDLGKLQKVQGAGAGQPQITPGLVRILDSAQQDVESANKTEADIESRYTNIGMRRAEEGISVTQLLWCIMLVKENLWEYLRNNENLENTAQIFGELVLTQMVDQFFDRAMYYAVAGHESARESRMAS